MLSDGATEGVAEHVGAFVTDLIEDPRATSATREIAYGIHGAATGRSRARRR